MKEGGGSKGGQFGKQRCKGRDSENWGKGEKQRRIGTKASATLMGA